MLTKPELGKLYCINVDTPYGGDMFADVSEWEIDEGTGRLEFIAHSTNTGDTRTFRVITTKPYVITEDLWASRRAVSAV